MSFVTQSLAVFAVWWLAATGVALFTGRFLRLAGANDELPAAYRTTRQLPEMKHALKEV